MDSKLPNNEQLDKHREKGVRPSYIACFIHEHKLMFVYKQEWELWQLPQGGIENGETIIDAIVRGMKDELDANFVEAADLKPKIFGKDQINFPPKKQGGTKLVTNSGEQRKMKGKYYYFVAIEVEKRFVQINKTDFDMYAWLNKYESEDIVETIHQKGKQRVTKNIIDLLVKNNILK